MLQPGTPKEPDNDENIVHSKFSEKYYLNIWLVANSDKNIKT